MKDLPELDAELSGLLAEIAADPRSRLRLAPKRALKSWYLSDEVTRPRDFDRTKAERHLVAAHRDALAELLLRAARVAYWRKPIYSIPFDCAGTRQITRELEQGWTRVRLDGLQDLLSGLLVAPENILFEHGEALAMASLALAPSDSTRLVLACLKKAGEPRSAASFLDQISGPLRDPKVYPSAQLEAGSCLAIAGDFQGALARYAKAATWSPLAFLCQFNLYAFSGDRIGAKTSIRPMAAISREEFAAACEQLSDWARAQPHDLRARARAVFDDLSDLFASDVRAVSKIYDL